MTEETAPVSVLTCANCGTKNRIRPSGRGGQPVDRIVGALPKPQLVARLSPHLTQAA